MCAISNHAGAPAIPDTVDSAAVSAVDPFAVRGYRRLIRVEPGEGRVRAALEDDIHAMAVTLRHADGVVQAAEPEMARVPWTTCPGAAQVLADTFTGTPLAQVTARRERQANCTHLHDLAILAAAHAAHPAACEYAIAVSDPQAGERILEIHRDGALLHRWTEKDGIFTAPGAIEGQSLMTLRHWIGALCGTAQEAARLLQWAGLVAHGRTLSDERKHAALFTHPSCFTMQPGRAENARPASPMLDFSSGERTPLSADNSSINGHEQTGEE